MSGVPPPSASRGPNHYGVAIKHGRHQWGYQPRCGKQDVSYLPLDLSDLANVREFVRSYEGKQSAPISAL